MTDLERQAEEYAEYRLKSYDVTLLKAEAKALIADAYEQGWVDRGRKEFNDDIAKRSDFAPDCTYFDCGDCKKGLPDTPCELSKCVAYTRRGGGK